MKSIYLSLFLCIVPHIAYASSEATSSSAKPSLQTFARIIKLADIGTENLVASEKNETIRQGDLFLIGGSLMYAGKPKDNWAGIALCIDEQGNHASIKPTDVLAQVEVRNKDSITSWTSSGFPQYLPLSWIEGAKTGDFIKLTGKSHQICKLQLECKPCGQEPFEKILKIMKDKMPSYHRDEIDLLVQEGALQENPKPYLPPKAVTWDSWNDGEPRWTNVNYQKYVPGPNGFKPTSQSNDK